MNVGVSVAVRVVGYEWGVSIGDGIVAKWGSVDDVLLGRLAVKDYIIGGGGGFGGRGE